MGITLKFTTKVSPKVILVNPKTCLSDLTDPSHEGELGITLWRSIPESQTG